MDKTSNILIFLQRLNDYRSTGVYEMPKKEFEITSKLFLIIADKINKEESIECIQLFLIVSQTFYYTNDENKKEEPTLLINVSFVLPTSICTIQEANAFKGITFA